MDAQAAQRATRTVGACLVLSCAALVVFAYIVASSFQRTIRIQGEVYHDAQSLDLLVSAAVDLRVDAREALETARRGSKGGVGREGEVGAEVADVIRLVETMREQVLEIVNEDHGSSVMDPVRQAEMDKLVVAVDALAESTEAYVTSPESSTSERLEHFERSVSSFVSSATRLSRSFRGLVLHGASDRAFLSSQLVSPLMVLGFLAALATSMGCAWVVRREIRLAVSSNLQLADRNLELESLRQELLASNEELTEQKGLLEENQTRLQEALEHAEIQRAMHDHASRRFQSLFEGLPVGCMTFDGTGTVIEFNRRMGEIVDIETHFALLNPVTSVLRAQGREEAILELLSRTSAGEESTLEWSFRTSVGERTVQIYFFPLRNHMGEIVGGIGCAIDMTAEKDAKAQIAEMASLQGAVLASAEYSIIATDREGLVTIFNPAAERMLGYSADEVIGRMCLTDFHEATELELRGAVLESEHGVEASGLTALTYRAAGGQAEESEWQYVRKDGGLFDVRLSVAALEGADGALTGFLAVGQDVTEEKATAERLRLLSLVAEQATSGVAIMDAAAHILFVNSAFEKTTGFRLEELVGSTPFSWRVSEETDVERLQALTQAMRRRSAAEEDLLCRRPDGGSYWVRVHLAPIVSESGEVTHLVAIEEDVSERKATEMIIIESEERFRHVVEAAGEYIWEVDPEFRFTYVSDQVEAVWGYRPHELIGRQPVEFLDRTDRKRVQDQIAKALLSQEGFTNLVMRSSHKSGGLIWQRLNAVPFRGEDGQLLGFRGAGLDITAQKEAEDALDYANRTNRGILESIKDSFYSLDADWRFTFVNSSAAKGFGKSERELLGERVTSQYDGDSWGLLWSALEMVQKTKKPRVLVILSQESQQWLEFRLYPSEERGVSVFYQDVTERVMTQKQIEDQMVQLNEANIQLEIQQMQLEEANAKLMSMASTDGLTGLKNHKTFQEFLSDQFHAAESAGLSLGVVLMDVDKFKQYNDSYGHVAGDEVLKRVARTLRSVVKEPHLVARYGGEEFVIVAVGMGVEEIMELAEEARMAIEDQDWPNRDVTASFGVAVFGPGLGSKQELIERADTALYASKEAGRNRVSLWSPRPRAA